MFSNCMGMGIPPFSLEKRGEEKIKLAIFLERKRHISLSLPKQYETERRRNIYFFLERKNRRTTENQETENSKNGIACRI